MNHKDEMRRLINLVEGIQNSISEASSDPIRDFAKLAHDNWRAGLKPEDRNKERPRSKRGGPVQDINVDWDKLHPTAQEENLEAAHAAKEAVEKFPNDDERAAEHIHIKWMGRNPKDDYTAPLHVPYNQLPEVEKQKDRDQVKIMKDLMGM